MEQPRVTRAVDAAWKIGWILATALLVYGAQRLSIHFPLPGTFVSVVWPSTGIALALAVLLGPWTLIGLVIGETAAQTPVLGSPLRALAGAVLAALQLLVISLVVRRSLGGAAVFTTPSRILRYVGLSLAALTLSATGGVANAANAGLIEPAAYAPSWVTWWASDCVAALLVAPLIIVLHSGARPETRAARAEPVVFGLAVAVVVLGVVADFATRSAFPLAMFGLPLVVWAGFRFGPRSVMVTSALLAASALVHLLVPWRETAAGTADLLRVQAFVAMASVLGLVIAASVRLERDRIVRAAQQKFHAVDEARNRLLHAFAHELNNPLTPMTLQIDTLRTGKIGPITERQERSLRVLKRNIERLSNLVRDLRDVSVMQAGERLRLARRPIDLASVVLETVNLHQPRAIAAAVRLEHDLSDPLPLMGDADRLQQVFHNILDNAIKYSTAGSTVTVRARADTTHIHVTVHDEGAGLSDDQIARLFQPFGQVQDYSLQKSGTGLGLYIARGIVEGHGGRITCRSDGVGRGATFEVALPITTPDQGPPAKPDEAARDRQPPQVGTPAPTTND